jgi:hypothetical protein
MALWYRSVPTSSPVSWAALGESTLAPLFPVGLGSVDGTKQPQPVALCLSLDGRPPLARRLIPSEHLRSILRHREEGRLERDTVAYERPRIRSANLQKFPSRPFGEQG